MNRPLVGVQMIVFGQTVLEEGYEKVLRYISGLGVHEIELSKVPVNRETVPVLKKLCPELGLHACAMNANMHADSSGSLCLDENLDELAGFARELDCGYIRVGSMPNWVYGKEEAHLRLAEMLNQYGKRLKEYGIKFYYHHHEFEFQKYRGKYGLEILMENTDPDLVGFEMDTHWLQYGGQDPVKWIYRMKGRADLVHLKDYRIVMPKEGVTGEEKSPKVLRKKDVQFAEIGTGNLDMPAIIDACIETGVKYMPIEQDTSYDLSPYESIRISVENIKKMGYEDCF